MTSTSDPKRSHINFKAGKHFLMPGYHSYMKQMFTAIDKPGKQYDLYLWVLLGPSDGKCLVVEMKDKTYAECRAEIDKFVGRIDKYPQEMKDAIIEDYKLND